MRRRNPNIQSSDCSSSVWPEWTAWSRWSHGDAERSSMQASRRQLKPSAKRFPARKQIVAGLAQTIGDPLLGGLQIAARIVLLLVADFTVDLEHARVILEHVVGDRPREGVLRVGVDVHLDDAVAQSFANLLDRRSRSAVKD